MDRDAPTGPSAVTRAGAAAATAPTTLPRASGERPSASRPVGTAPRRGFTRERCLVVGGLVGLVAAVGVIFATTHSPPPRPIPVSARIVSKRPRVWIVRPGQTLSTIAQRENVDVGALARLNPGIVPTALGAGQHVTLPG